MSTPVVEMPRRGTCRLCGAAAPELVLALPPMPLAGHPLPVDALEHERRYPIDVHRCAACGLVQLLDVLPASFYQDYRYTPSHAGGFKDYVEALAGELMARYAPRSVLEIGSSDGALLAALGSRGARVAGFEPSARLAAEANQRGVFTVPSYFSRAAVDALPADRLPFDMVVIRHVLEHLDDFADVLAAVDRALDRERGIFVVEVPYLGNILDEAQYYAFFNEHLSYFSLTSMERLLVRHGFRVAAARKVFPEGGSMLVVATRGPGVAIRDLAGFGDDGSLGEATRLRRFAGQLQTFRLGMRGFVAAAHARGRRLAAWGAGQRGVSLLNICGLTDADLEFVVDVNPAYHGLTTPGSRIPIVPPAELYRRRPDGVIVFATGYLDSIRAEHRPFETDGGRFISIVPDLRWLDPERRA